MQFGTALDYNWWTIFMRQGIPDKHAEAITSRPLALHRIARQTRHSNQTTVEVTSTHAKAPLISSALAKVNGFLRRIKASAEQLTQTARWTLILRAAFHAESALFYLILFKHPLKVYRLSAGHGLFTLRSAAPSGLQ